MYYLKDMDIGEKVKLALSSNDINTLTELANDSNLQVNCALVLNKNVTIPLLKKLMQKDSKFLKIYIAEQTSEQEILDELSKSNYSEVRIAVASNQHTPNRILRKLLRDADWRVRSAIARNATVSKKALVYLSRDPHWMVRRTVAEKPRTPSTILASMSLNDPVREVREAAKDTLLKRKSN